ncbi:MAG: hypothetical protein J7619_11860 [Dyadobacter sp.]|uniref:hypothetical protein n=1 Tax=Dyadobacter sp. TaxID=1914288 RepID=UPI001B0AD92D|nr:hypothetical protein [Dyadobacter sp.]MBO9613388.1 hypothetical protein [Dyadobacter sp.]
MSQYTTADMVSFGEYILSEERSASIRKPINQSRTLESDLANWSAKQGKSFVDVDHPQQQDTEEVLGQGHMY